MPKPASVAEYLAAQPADRRAALERLRKTLHALRPGLEECISYSMPAFRYRGHVVAGFLATGRGCSYYPFSGTTLGTLAAKLGGCSRTKSALHFEPRKPLPQALVKLLLDTRIAETATAAKRRAKRPAAASAPKTQAPHTGAAPRAEATSARRPQKTRGAAGAKSSAAPRTSAARGRSLTSERAHRPRRG